MGHPDDLAALARVALVPRALHDVVDPDPRLELWGRSWPSPVVRRGGSAGADLGAALTLVDAAEVRASHPARIPVVGAGRMGELMPEIRRLADLQVLALALDLGPLADAAPYGAQPWRPRSREDLAELLAAAGRPVWLLGVASAEDATVAAEAGFDALVVDAGIGRHLGGPATADVLPEVVDAVAGMVRVLAGGRVGSGVDVLRLLALGADAVVVGGERPTSVLEEELRYAMRLTGCATLADIGYDVVFAPLFGDP
jgi:isopentenyl diphosphate isomerase/L-lactate dehydrogenase-like FMN-dependent dehydrogenase